MFELLLWKGSLSTGCLCEAPQKVWGDATTFPVAGVCSTIVSLSLQHVAALSHDKKGLCAYPQECCPAEDRWHPAPQHSSMESVQFLGLL